MDVVVKGTGRNNAVFQQTDPVHRAARVSIRPLDKGVFGAYSIGLQSGLMAAGLAPGSTIYAFRWSTVGVWALIRRIEIKATADTVLFAQGAAIFSLTRAQAFSVQATGGQVINFIGKSGARSTRFPASSIQIANSATGNIAISNTGALVPGTLTLDSQPISILMRTVGGAVLTQLVDAQPLDPSDVTREPLELAVNEGFIITATVPITGTWRFSVNVDFDEVTLDQYLGG
jgi:hypothetical protein